MKDERDPLDEFLEMGRRLLAHPVPMVKDERRFKEVERAMCEIAQFFLETDDDVQFKVGHDELLGTSMFLSVTCFFLSVADTERFCAVIRKADDVSIDPLTNGKLSIMFGFNNVYHPYIPIGRVK